MKLCRVEGTVVGSAHHPVYDGMKLMVVAPVDGGDSFLAVDRVQAGVGDVVVTRKDENLTGVKLLVLQPLAADGSKAGRTLVAVDAAGAGVGETVFFVRGKEASFPFYPAEVPADAGIVGIVDRWDLG